MESLADPGYDHSPSFDHRQLTDLGCLDTDGIPIFYKRCGLTRELFNLVIELRPMTTSAGLAERFKRESFLTGCQDLLA